MHTYDYKTNGVKRSVSDMESEERAISKDYLSGNTVITDTIARFHLEESRDHMCDVLDSFWQRMRENGYILIPILDPKPE